jgi:hypothetical protein
MEVTITIREGASATTIVQTTAEPGAQPSAQPPSAVSLQAAGTGATDAGPAPVFNVSGQAGVPPPFIGHGNAKMSPEAASSTSESAGAAPASESRITTSEPGRGA